MKRVRRIVVLGVFATLLAAVVAPASSLAATWNDRPQDIPPGTFTGCVTGATGEELLAIGIAVGRGFDSITEDGRVACWNSLTGGSGGERERFRAAAADVATYDSTAAPLPSIVLTPSWQHVPGPEGYAEWTITVAKDPQDVGTLIFDTGDGGVINRAIPSGEGTVTFELSHLYSVEPEGWWGGSVGFTGSADVSFDGELRARRTFTVELC